MLFEDSVPGYDSNIAGYCDKCLKAELLSKVSYDYPKFSNTFNLTIFLGIYNNLQPSWHDLWCQEE